MYITCMEQKPIKENVMRCSACGGTVNRFETQFKCQDCGAVGDLVTGIMVDMELKHE